ncbi:hypothetical protein FIBSPDRAFT_901857 [Athelia psychrophila]|uniref:Uncharacterized protein n=1 Tax=Athelia psychrophila TaxID=1759441 RepID=A0A165WLD6_9AGAM|nr:hypothetical protein FIBSPDRAFT_901857 [Fibularhizoctonia sp. CBS 109695]
MSTHKPTRHPFPYSHIGGLWRQTRPKVALKCNSGKHLTSNLGLSSNTRPQLDLIHVIYFQLLLSCAGRKMKQDLRKMFGDVMLNPRIIYTATFKSAQAKGMNETSIF